VFRFRVNLSGGGSLRNRNRLDLSCWSEEPVVGGREAFLFLNLSRTSRRTSNQQGTYERNDYGNPTG
jgi:hypothetical protein